MIQRMKSRMRRIISKGSSSNVQKRKLSDYIGQLDIADASLELLRDYYR